MIDSIVFRIHNLERHKPLIKYLHQTNISGQSSYLHHYDPQEVFRRMKSDESGNLLLTKDEVLKFVEDKHISKIQNTRHWIDHQTGRDIEGKYRSHLPSSHYHIAYAIDFHADYVEFNFSVPKYLYRTNVFQFVPHFFDNDYSPARDYEMQDLGVKSLQRLRNFLVMFFDRELGGMVDKYEVQMVRIDLCFNKLFNSKHQAMDYLNDVKRIRKKHLRDTGKWTAYFGGISIVGRDLTFKIYHKGLEFQTNDRKELKDLPLKKVEAIQDFADKMVRYELEFKTGGLSKLFLKKVFRKESIVWKKAKRYAEQFMQNGFIVREGKNLYRTPPIRDKEGNKLTRDEIRSMKMSPRQWALVKYGKFYVNKTFHFHLRSDSNLYLDSHLWDAEIDDSNFRWTKDEWQQKLSKNLWRAMVGQFRMYFREFSIKYSDHVTDIISDIESNVSGETERSEALRRKVWDIKGSDKLRWIKAISFSTVKQFLNNLKTQTFSEIKALGTFPPSTFYRYQAFFRIFGFNDFAPQQYIPLSDDTYSTYYDWVDDVNSKLHFENLFRVKFGIKM